MFVLTVVLDQVALCMSRHPLFEGYRRLTDVDFRGVTLLCLACVKVDNVAPLLKNFDDADGF